MYMCAKGHLHCLPRACPPVESDAHMHVCCCVWTRAGSCMCASCALTRAKPIK